MGHPYLSVMETHGPLGTLWVSFGLIAFYYLCVVARVGGYVLGLPPTLYALPAMLAAAAAVRVADGLKESGRAERPVALLRLAGYAISALAFALALAVGTALGMAELRGEMVARPIELVSHASLLPVIPATIALIRQSSKAESADEEG